MWLHSRYPVSLMLPARCLVVSSRCSRVYMHFSRTLQSFVIRRSRDEAEHSAGFIESSEIAESQP